MKKFFITMLVSWVLLAVVAVIAVKFYLDPQLKILIEQKGTELLGGPVKLQSAETHLLPFKIVLNNLSIKLETPQVEATKPSQLDANIKTTEISLNIFDLLQKKAAIQLKVISPSISYETFQSVDSKKTQVSTQNIESSPPILEQLQQQPYLLALNLAVQDGTVNYKSPGQSLTLNDFSILLEMPSPQAEWVFKTGADVSYGTYKIPVFLDAHLKAENELLKFSNTKAIISGVDILLNGELNMQTMATQVKLESKIPQLESLNAPIDTGCAKLKSGGLEISITASTKAQFESPTANGQVNLQKIKAELSCNLQDIKIAGPLDLESQVVFKYGPSISFDKLKVQTDLSLLDIKYKDLFKKSVKKSLYIDIDATQSGDKFYLKSGNVRLDKIQLKSKGVASYTKGSISDIEINLARTSLRGLEDLFPILASQPVDGEVELAAKVKGDLTNPTSLDIEVSPLLLQNIRASFSWQSADKTMTLKGPLALNLNGVMSAQGSQLKSAKITADLDLNKFEIQSPYLVKSAQHVLSLNFDAEQKQNKVVIKKGLIVLPGGTVKATGSISSPQKPILDLNFKTEKARLEPLLKLMPTMSAYRVSGTADANLTLGGQYDFAGGIEKSPLSLKGQVKLAFDSVVTPPKPKLTPVKPGDPPPKEVPVSAEPFLSPWPIYKNANIQIVSNIKQVKYDDLLISGIATTHSFIGGRLLSSGIIQSIFGGRFTLNDSSYNMIERSPTLAFSGNAQSVQIGQAVAWVSPEWKDLVRGSTNGQFRFKIIHPSVKDYLQQSTGEGNFNISNGFLNTLSFDQMANEKISKIPGLSSRSDLKINSKGATGDIVGVFGLASGKMNFAKFDVTTPEKNEMRAKGWVGLDKTMDLSADLYLSDPPVKGSVREANSDATGRLIVPVKISGQVFSPNIDITNDTVKVLLEKTARLEGAKLQQKATQEVQKQGKKIGEDLKQEAEKKLKNLFK